MVVTIGRLQSGSGFWRTAFPRPATTRVPNDEYADIAQSSDDSLEFVFSFQLEQPTLTDANTGQQEAMLSSLRQLSVMRSRPETYSLNLQQRWRQYLGWSVGSIAKLGER